MKKSEKDLILEDIMMNYGDELIRLAFTYVKDEETAKDMVQNTFIKCYQNLNSFRYESHIKTWLYRITINECKDHLKSWYYRKVQMIDFLEDTVKSIIPSVEKALIKKSDSEEMVDVIFSLPKIYREVVYLYYYESLKIDEIADVIDISGNTVKTRLRRARKKLKPMIKEAELNEK